MRIERYETPPPLTPRVIEFLMTELKGICVDDVVSAEERRIDYICLSGLFAVELKSLEGSPQERIDNFVNNLRKRDDYPQPIGPSANLERMVLQMEKPERILSDLRSRLGRPIRNHLDKANDQFASHEKRFPRKNVVRTVILVNEDHAEYEPTLVEDCIRCEIGTRHGEPMKYSHIDMVLYLTERHQAAWKDEYYYPILAISGPVCQDALWKRTVIMHVMQRWALFKGGVASASSGLEGFVPVADVPPAMKRHEKWKLDYERDPYFRHLTDEQLADVYDEIVLLNHIRLLRMMPEDSPQFPSVDVMAHLTHVFTEVGARGNPASVQGFSLKRDVAAARRLKLPNSLVRMLRKDHARRQRHSAKSPGTT